MPDPKLTFIDGAEELIITIGKMENSISRKAMVTGVRAGLSVLARDIRKAVSAAPVSTPHAASLKAGMRKLVGSRFVKGGMDKLGRAHPIVAKVGFGVGKKSDDRMSKGETEGTNKNRVGVTRGTAHWFTLGVQGRNPGGDMPAFFKGIVGQVAQSSGEKAMQAVVTKSKARFLKLVEKERAKRVVRK